MFKFTNYVMLFAPFGVGAAMAHTIGTQGLGVLANLGKLVLSLYLALIIFVVGIFGLVVFIARVPLRQFMRAVREPGSVGTMLVAITTTGAIVERNGSTQELAADSGVDSSRIAVMGGSYGGYMVLACMTHFNDRLRCGIDIVGIGTELEITPGPHSSEEGLQVYFTSVLPGRGTLLAYEIKGYEVPGIAEIMAKIEEIFDNIYLVVIGKVFSAIDLGYFTRAKTLQNVPSQTLAGVVARVTFPVFSTIQDDPDRMKRGLKKALTILVMVNFPLMIGIAAVAAVFVAAPIMGAIINARIMPIR